MINHQLIFHPAQDNCRISSPLFDFVALTLKIGTHHFTNTSTETPLILAPMAGVTDLPFRRLCIKYGASAAVSEMIAAKPALWKTQKSLKRQHHHHEAGVRWVQIAGADAALMAQAAKYNANLGADIIDINMGCPAKKVCRKAAGSALLQHPRLVGEILTAVVRAVDKPVTLKIRTGSDKENRNALEIAKIAEDCGIQALTIHGRTRACKFVGAVEYDTIHEVKKQVKIPVIANGDIDSPEKARLVLLQTGADALMIGRAAQGKPWIFQEIRHYLAHAQILENYRPLRLSEKDIGQILLHHVSALHEFYGEHMGLRIARKHVGWYLNDLPFGDIFKKQFNKIENAALQLLTLNDKFNHSAYFSKLNLAS